MMTIKKLKQSLGYFAATTLILSLTACHDKNPAIQGYVEGNFTYISPQVGGTLSQLLVKRGSTVKKNQRLFQLSLAPENDQLKAAAATKDEAQANLQDLLSNITRRPAIASLMAEKKIADAKLSYAKKQYERLHALVNKDYISKQQYDAAEMTLRQSIEGVKKAKQDIIGAHLSARIHQIFAARAKLKAAQAKLKMAQWNISQKTQIAPFSGMVNDTYYSENETVQPNRPVLSLLAPKDLRIIFYVSAKQRNTLKIGQPIVVHANDTKNYVPATINYMADQAEYTPPFIYSETNNNNLVFQVRAKLHTTHWILWPGQPVIIDLHHATTTTPHVN